MTHEEKYKAVEKAIRKACPETMELTNGCLFVCKFEPLRIPRIKECLGVRGDKVYCRSFGGIATTSSNCVHKDFVSEIIGHPLRLSHVLRAIEVNRKELMQCSTQANSLVVKWGDGSHMVYNLLTDDLSKASTETISFLYDVLCK